MHILILGADNFIGDAIEACLLEGGRHTVESLSQSACRWKRERHAKKAVRRSGASLVIDTRVIAATRGMARIHESDVERTLWVASACEKSGKSLVFLSSARVFAGHSGRMYAEDHPVDNTDSTLGNLLIRCENHVNEGCRRALLVRTGPVYSAVGSNPLTWLLERLLRGESVEVDGASRVCPLPSRDVARAVAGIVDQLSTGIEPWGVYHHCSADSTTCFEFAEAVLASAAQFAAIEAGVSESVSGEARGGDWVLECSALRRTFAVKQIPWRPCVAASVREYFEAGSR